MNVAGGLCLGQNARSIWGKGKGAGALFLYPLYYTPAGGRCRCHLVCKPSGLTHSEAGRVSSAKSLDHGPGEPTLHRLLAIDPCSDGLKRPQAVAWGCRCTSQRQQAVVLGMKGMLNPTGCISEALLQQTHSTIQPSHTLRVNMFGLLLHMFTHGTELLALLEEAPGLVDFLGLHTALGAM
ncbi:hypothetical protein N657DRAFT_13880 [Parathielavia appendiculata]|uniref:Uncharacterized protein n=1 Tax=Parathielavia appendiculata TaxID=2587402 RepID=A0AAN6U971_9PEZI|nr:hypothetical protein N657DRAFT_13880 [Parathielavia appendiculata]